LTAKLYNQFWHADGASERKVPGLQSRYYRLLDESVRDRKKEEVGRPELGILAKTDRRYWWMAGAYSDGERADLERDKQAISSRKRNWEAANGTTASAEPEEQSEIDSENQEEASPPQAFRTEENVQPAIEKGKGKATDLPSPMPSTSGDDDPANTFEGVSELPKLVCILRSFKLTESILTTKQGPTPSIRLRNHVSSIRPNIHVPAASGYNSPGAPGGLTPVLEAIRLPRTAGSARISRKVRTRKREQRSKRPRYGTTETYESAAAAAEKECKMEGMGRGSGMPTPETLDVKCGEMMK